MSEVIYLPFNKRLYDDVVRFSDGQCDLLWVMEDQFHDFIRRTADDYCHGVIGDDPVRLRQFLAIYHPDIVARWEAEEASNRTNDAVSDERWSPLVWKEVEVPAGSEVRMQYGGAYHSAKIIGGKIVDRDGQFSPSEWASKVAGGTNRNAWRDLYFRFPGKQEWAAASTLRDLRRQELARLADIDPNDIFKDL